MLYGPALPNVYFCNILRMYAAGANMDATNAKTKENTASLAVKSGNSALLQVLPSHPPPSPLPHPSPSPSFFWTEVSPMFPVNR